ncbi:MAG: GNAT family N-acetyltransferase [Asgard group archaeon]|nr:GNAT family N-acetyltransferase [Asgard group archaeon]
MEITQFSTEMYNDVFKLWKDSGLSLGASDTKDQVERLSEMNPDLFLVGIKDSKIIAVVAGAFDGRRGYVHHLTVDSQYRRKGYGRKMMEELHKLFSEKNIIKVHLFVEIESEEVIEFYKKIGWHVRDDLEMMSFVPE